MHPEIKNILLVLLSMVLMVISYIALIVAMFKMVIEINIEGIAIALLAIFLGAAGDLLVLQKNQDLTKKQFIKKTLNHSIVYISIIITLMVFSDAVRNF